MVVPPQRSLSGEILVSIRGQTGADFLCPGVHATSELRSHIFLTPNLRYQGSVPFERNNPEDQACVVTDEWGFVSDAQFADETARKKGPHEFRIIVVGGSGAQGHGDSCLDATFERRLEKSLAASLAAKDAHWKVRVYNLAIMGQFAEDNYHVLHQFGHALDPDLIVFYNGPNDLAHVTFWVLPKAMAKQAEKTLDTEFAWEEKNLSPGYVQFFNRNFPYLGRKHQLFHKIAQTVNPGHYAQVRERLNIDFLKRWDISTSDDDNARRILAFLDNKRVGALPGKREEPYPAASGPRMVLRTSACKCIRSCPCAASWTASSRSNAISWASPLSSPGNSSITRSFTTTGSTTTASMTGSMRTPEVRCRDTSITTGNSCT